MTQLVSIIGYQGSGKTTIGKEVAKRLKTEYVEVSAVVKAANKHVPDLELASTGERTFSEPNWLAKLIDNEIEDVMSIEGRQTVIVGGSREPNLYQWYQDKGYHLYSVWLYAEPFSRYNRLIKQGRVENTTQFLNRELAERRLGLSELARVTQYQAETSDKIYPHQTAAAIVHFLKEKGLET